jgi:predicted RNA-binding protein YlqC (UPF0109 family)
MEDTDPMTAILIAAGVATAATVVFTGVMTLSGEQCCERREANVEEKGIYRSTKLAKEPLVVEEAPVTKKKRRKKRRSKKNKEEKQENAEEIARREKKAEKKRLQKLKKKQQKSSESTGTISTTTTKSKVVAPVVDEDDGWTTVSTKKKSKPQKKSSNDSDRENEPPVSITTTTTTTTSTTVETVTDTVRIDVRKVGAIVGKGGATLHAIQDKTGVKIDTPSRKDDEVDRKKKSQIPSIQRSTVWATITIRGPKKGVKTAKVAIESIATKGFCRLLNPEITEGFMSVSSKNLRDIIGPGGAFVKAIQKATETNIRIPRTDGYSKAGDKTRVYVVGSKHNVREAKDAMKSLIKLYWSKYTHPNQTYQEVSVPEDKLGRVIGPKGHTIKSIQGDTKTKIHTPPTYSNNVIIVGSESGIAKAVARIKKVVEEEPEKKSISDMIEEGDDEELGDE